MDRLFDIRPLQYSFNNGGAEYCKIIFFEICSNGMGKSFDYLINKGEAIDLESETMIRDGKLKTVEVNNESELSSIINRYDLFYSALPYNYYKLKLSPKVKFIFTIHGLRDIEIQSDKYYLRFEQYRIKAIVKSLINYLMPSYFKNVAKSRINRLLNVSTNRKIYVVSNHTKYSLLSNFPYLKSSEINVCYSPLKVTHYIKDDKTRLVEEKYVLMVSGNRWMKNNLRAALAVDDLISKKLFNKKVVITGVKNKRVYETTIINKKNFIFYEYIDTLSLDNLYANADLFIFPSLNEGFGYPPIEAMRYGTPCICAADTAITEICGNAVLYFNPYDIDEIETRILEIEDSSIRNDIVNKGKQRYEDICLLQKDSLKLLVEDICQ